MYNFFGPVNEVESHKKYRQSDLSLGNYWVTQCGWLRLCMTVAMGITITNFYKIFCYGHRWELPGNYTVFDMVMAIYHYVEIIGEFYLPLIFPYNIYDHEKLYLGELVHIHIQ